MHGRGGQASTGNTVSCCLMRGLHGFFGFKFFAFIILAMLDITSVKPPPRLAALGWLSPPACVIPMFAEHVSFQDIARIMCGGKSRAVDSAGSMAGRLYLPFLRGKWAGSGVLDSMGKPRCCMWRLVSDEHTGEGVRMQTGLSSWEKGLGKHGKGYFAGALWSGEMQVGQVLSKRSCLLIPLHIPVPILS